MCSGVWASLVERPRALTTHQRGQCGTERLSSFIPLEISHWLILSCLAEAWAWAPGIALCLLLAQQGGEPEAGVHALQREGDQGARSRPAVSRHARGRLSREGSGSNFTKSFIPSLSSHFTKSFIPSFLRRMQGSGGPVLTSLVSSLAPPPPPPSHLFKTCH